jgi:hypothetical protein
MSKTDLLIIPFLIALVGAVIASLSKRRIQIRVRTSGKLTERDYARLYTRSIIPSILYGTACGLFWAMLNMTSLTPISFSEQILSSWPFFGIGFIGGFLLTVRQVIRLKQWLQRHHRYDNYY